MSPERFAGRLEHEGEVTLCYETIYRFVAAKESRRDALHLRHLLRQYFPSSTGLEKVTAKEVIITLDKRNSRPKKCLGYRTPYEAFKDLTGVGMREIMGYVLT